jgi:hypothetical protein
MTQERLRARCYEIMEVRHLPAGVAIGVRDRKDFQTSLPGRFYRD